MHDTIAMIALVAIVLFYVVFLGLAIASYVTNALGLYHIAKKRQIQNPFLAWLPIGNLWILGSIADDFETQKGLNRKWRVVSLVFSALIFGFFILMYILLIVTVISVTLAGGETLSGAQILPMVLIYVLFFFMAVSAVAAEVLNILCLYKVFDEIYPEKAMKYILLSFMVPLAMGICLLKCKDRCEDKKDLEEDIQPTLFDVPELPRTEACETPDPFDTPDETQPEE